MKKIFFIIIFATLFLSNTAFANIIFNYPSPYYMEDFTEPFLITCSEGEYFSSYVNNLMIFSEICTGGYLYGYGSRGTQLFIEFTQRPELDFYTPELARATPEYISQRSFKFLERVSAIQGEYTQFLASGESSNLLASVASATQTTTRGLNSPLAVVLGVIVAFICLRFIVVTIRSADYEKKE